jgi:hypothetical protein
MGNNTAVKSIVAAMKSIANIQQEQNKLKMNLFENSEKYRQNFMMGLMKQRSELENKKAMMPYDIESDRLKKQNMSPLDQSLYNRINGTPPSESTITPSTQPTTQPKLGSADIQNSLLLDKEARWQGIPENERRYYFEPEQIYENVKGISLPTNRYKPPTLREEGKRYYEEKSANLQKAKQLKDQALDYLNTIQEVKNRAHWFGPVEGRIHPLLNSDKTEWSNNLNKLLSAKILNTMNEMKAASKTGATGFGQLNRSELGVLQNASTALKSFTDEKSAMRYLNRMEVATRKALGERPEINNSISKRVVELRQAGMGDLDIANSGEYNE